MKDVTEGVPKTVLLVIPTLGGGGAERVASLLSCAMTRAQMEVNVAVFTLEDQVFSVCGNVVNLGLPPKGSRASAKLLRSIQRSVALVKLLRKSKPELIVSFMESANFPTIIACAASGNLGRLRVTVHGNPEIVGNPSVRLAMRLLYPLAVSVVVPSAGIRDAFSNLGFQVKSIEVIPNPTEVHVSPGHVPYPLENHVKYILGVGRLEHVKGFDRLIRIFSMVKDPNLRLVILGEGSEEANLRELVQSLGVSDRVLLTGFVQNLEPWFIHAQCLCLTSRSESASMVIVEALGYGCPVISFDVDYGPREILDNGNYGVLVPQDDMESFAEAIEGALIDKQDREAIIQRGKKRYLDYSPDKIARLWCDDGSG